jgi:hypothetical protein
MVSSFTSHLGDMSYLARGVRERRLRRTLVHLSALYRLICGIKGSHNHEVVALPDVIIKSDSVL